ncbi:uncharacterized protein [Pyrus communis]|uniref:uncharacterized protein n=1 Tax=Pyrus communis TaxID=23211 RepID=UPI0035BED86D
MRSLTKKMKHGATHNMWQLWLRPWCVSLLRNNLNGVALLGRSYKPRNRAMMHANLINKYFNPNSMYTEDDFRHRFQMRHHIFEHLLHDVQQVNPYFQQKLDRVGCPGFSPHQKVTVALRMMAYGSPADSMDETYGMSEFTCLDTLVEFCNTIVQLYKDEYLYEPNQEDMDRFICKAEGREFSGIIGSLDCMHWNWKNCPTGWQ